MHPFAGPSCSPTRGQSSLLSAHVGANLLVPPNGWGFVDRDEGPGRLQPPHLAGLVDPVPHPDDPLQAGGLPVPAVAERDRREQLVGSVEMQALARIR